MNMQRREPLRGLRGSHRWDVGLERVDHAVQAVFDAVPGRLIAYAGIVTQDETDGPTSDLDLLVLTPRGIAAISVTGTTRGAFDRRQNTLVGAHEGTARQVRQLGRSHRALAASCVGRTAAACDIPLFAVLALDGPIAPRLMASPWFDIDGTPRVARGISVVSMGQLGGYLRGRLWENPCRAHALRYLDEQLQRSVIARYDVRHCRTVTSRPKRARINCGAAAMSPRTEPTAHEAPAVP